MTADIRPTRPRTARKVTLAVFLAFFLLVPVVYGLVFFVVIPLLQGRAFDTPAELTAGDIESLRVHLLNRKELDGGEDVGPYFAAPEDFEALLAPLKAAEEVGEFPDAQGPFLGEYRVVLKSGRKEPIRLYWSRPPGVQPDGTPHPARLRFKIGNRLFEGAAAQAVVHAALASEPRGRPAG
jgi:hypothetical protein